jgi:hypothetical protein
MEAIKYFSIDGLIKQTLAKNRHFASVCEANAETPSQKSDAAENTEQGGHYDFMLPGPFPQV